MNETRGRGHELKVGGAPGLDMDSGRLLSAGFSCWFWFGPGPQQPRVLVHPRGDDPALCRAFPLLAVCQRGTATPSRHTCTHACLRIFMCLRPSHPGNWCRPLFDSLTSRLLFRHPAWSVLATKAWVLGSM